MILSPTKKKMKLSEDGQMDSHLKTILPWFRFGSAIQLPKSFLKKNVDRHRVFIGF